MLGCERDDEIAMGIGCAVPWHDQAAFRHGVCERSNGALDVGDVILNWGKHRLNPERPCRDLSSSQVKIVVGSGLGINDESHACKLRLDLFEHLQPFAANAWLVHG